MKAQLLKLLTVSLIILVMISPILVVWRIWQYHIEFIDAHYIAPSDTLAISNQTVLTTVNHRLFPLIHSIQQRLKPVASITTIPALGFMVSVLLGFCSGLLLNNLYQIRRSTALRQQVAILEKLWQQSIY